MTKDNVIVSPRGITVHHDKTGIQTFVDNDGVIWSKAEVGTRLYCFTSIVDAVHFADLAFTGESVSANRFSSFSHVEANPEALSAADDLAALAAREHGQPEKGV